jgi:Immunity protein Imm1
MRVEFTGQMDGKYLRDGEMVTEGWEDTRAAVDVLFDRSSEEQWTHAHMRLSGTETSMSVVVDPTSRAAILLWHAGYVSLNPTPLADAPLMPVDGDDEPLSYWLRNSYIPRPVAETGIREYLETGERPTSVQWQDWAYEVYTMPSSVDNDPDLAPLYHLITTTPPDPQD